MSGPQLIHVVEIHEPDRRSDVNEVEPAFEQPHRLLDTQTTLNDREVRGAA